MNIRRSFFSFFNRTYSNLNRLILINVFVIVLIKLLQFVEFVSGTPLQGAAQEITDALALPVLFSQALHQPWSFLTYMFLHIGLFPLLFDLWGLYWFGRLLEDFSGNKRLPIVYLLGGFVGGVSFVLFNGLGFSIGENPVVFIGSSASVMAVAVAAATLLPTYEVRLAIFGNVKLKTVVFFYVLANVLYLLDGRLSYLTAQIGGAVAGYLYVCSISRYPSSLSWLNKLTDFGKSILSRKHNLKIVPGNEKHSIKTPSSVSQKEIDRILDKISKSGYSSLTEEEKNTLFKASNEK